MDEQAWQDWIAFEHQFQRRNLEEVRKFPITPQHNLSATPIGGLALNAGQMGAFDLNIAGDTLWWSPQTYAVFGLSPDSFTPTRESVIALVHPDDRRMFVQRRSEAIAQHRPLALEFRILHILAANKGRVVPYERLIEYAWGHEGGSPSHLKIRICSIRCACGPRTARWCRMSPRARLAKEPAYAPTISLSRSTARR